ncbi:acyltransferase domain-containing protein, partial [Nocardia sp. NPDC059229]|uniref:acyltransferase domain-containing protein n=1 Tax=Nocardia sp. NPDC059229 TaxID=3346778 RepID=UPI003682AB96
AARLHEFLTTSTPQDNPFSPADVGWTLATGRSRFDHRAVVIGNDLDELLEQLQTLTTTTDSIDSTVVVGTAGRAGKTVFVFPGQGSQWLGMGQQLLDSCPVFAEAMTACDQALAPFVDWSLLDTIRGEGADLSRVDVVQPALFAVMVSLARVWESIGVTPNAVIGHSQGEIAAAYIADALSLQDAAKIVALRSRLLAEIAGHGGMVVVSLPEDTVCTRVQSWTGALDIAAVNGPGSVVVAGEEPALSEFVADCEAEEISIRRIAVDYGSHSPQVESLSEALIEALAPIRPRSSRITFYSSVTAGPMDTTGLDAQYWYRNLRSTVRFEQTIRALHADGHTVFVETSPHPALLAGIQDTLDTLGADRAAVVGTLRRDHGGWDQILRSAAAAFVTGADVDWAAMLAPYTPRWVDLPTYAFQR